MILDKELCMEEPIINEKDSMENKGAKVTGIQPRAKATEQEGKYKPHLVSEEFIQAVAEVRAYGVKKYGHEDGWQVTPDTDYLDAAARHINKTIAALQHGNMSELYDDELVDDKHVGSGLLNLAHAACDIMFIITKIKNCRSELVNRIKEMEDD